MPASDVLLSQALASGEPRSALLELARQWKAEGMQQVEMYAHFNSRLLEQRNAADDCLYDALADTMDIIVGWCSPSLALFPPFSKSWAHRIVTVQSHIEFEDADAKCQGFALVRPVNGAIGLTLALVGEGDFEVFMSSEKALELAQALNAAVDSQSHGFGA